MCEKKDAAPIDGVERTAVPVFFVWIDQADRSFSVTTILILLARRCDF